jgi:hypothetical protein
MQKSVEKIPSRRLGGGSASLGGMLAGLIGVVILSSPPSWDGPWTACLGFLYVSLGSQFLDFFFWNRGMALAGVAKTGQLQLLQPFVTRRPRRCCSARRSAGVTPGSRWRSSALLFWDGNCVWKGPLDHD